MKLKHTCLATAAVVLLAHCQKNDQAAAPPGDSAPAAPSAALMTVIDAAPSGEPKAIHVIRETAKPGDVITVSGRVMGNVSPFVEGRSAFILGDPEVLTPCNENPDDECETPWDVCCDSAKDKKRGTATIQVVDADGRVLKEGIEGVGGIEKLATLTIAGTVAEGSTPELLVINATAIDVAP
ncbi:hypothetical protein HAHE_23630 [Haloferula helveola]|uniref:Uncharacterized protein n=1 Tax=Haloferula helveola TaxID=490095 RepID=A0ABM7RGM0_9BACT|nr:hypothetical protein HAHE_23630 [Haloferula helveola]